MDYEKKYNDAMNLAKSYYGKGSNEFLDTIFPELRESEDERINKAIQKYLDWLTAYPIYAPRGEYSIRDMLHYLYNLERKQKEQKPVQSEEEKEYIRTLKSRIADFLRGKDKDEVDTTYYQRICDWLDGRHVEQSPAECPSWKPSEEQMAALHTAAYLEEMQFYGGLKDKLRDLYEQLKKL